MFLMHYYVGVYVGSTQYTSRESRGHPRIKGVGGSQCRRSCHCLLSRIHEMRPIIGPLGG